VRKQTTTVVPLIANQPEKKIVERTNWLTDDSDSDLDVIVDPVKAQVPGKFTLKDLTDKTKNP
jgi:hypothetical protein